MQNNSNLEANKLSDESLIEAIKKVRDQTEGKRMEIKPKQFILIEKPKPKGEQLKWKSQ